MPKLTDPQIAAAGKFLAEFATFFYIPFIECSDEAFEDAISQLRTLRAERKQKQAKQCTE